MTTILTVEDSRAVRNVIARQVLELGFDLEQAENGEQGLAKLKARSVDLVLLDVTMPVLDGPGMLERMRSAGNRTPVIMLTSEAKRSIVETTLKLGISDYVLKPFGADELRTKILAVLGERTEGAAPAPAVEPAPAPVALPAVAVAVASPPSPVAGPAGPPDVLIVDDVENVARKLRALVPEKYGISHSATAGHGLNEAARTPYKVILVDSEMPSDAGAPAVRGAALVAKLRELRPQAKVFALCLRTTNDCTAEMQGLGYHGVLFKPFRQADVDALAAAHLVEREEPLSHADDLLTFGASPAHKEHLDAYCARLRAIGPSMLEEIAAACHEHALLDVRRAPLDVQAVAEAVLELARHGRRIGLGVKVVFDQTGRSPFAGLPNPGLWMFESAEAARAAEIDPNAEPPVERSSWIANLQDL